MDFQALYQSKLTTAAEAAKLVKSGDCPSTFFLWLHGF